MHLLQLIREKVQYNIEKSEAAARVLVEMKQQKAKENAHDYDSLKEKWYVLSALCIHFKQL